MIKQNLKYNWVYRELGSKKDWKSAKVPGVIHLDLLSHKDIPDPFFRDNEKKIQWVESRDWEYKTIFTPNMEIFTQDRVELNFKGLDTSQRST